MFVDMDAFSLVTVETSGARGSFVDCIFARNHILAAEKQVRLGILTGALSSICVSYWKIEDHIDLPESFQGRTLLFLSF